MSPWYEALGSLLILAGVKVTWDNVRLLVPRSTRRSDPSRAERRARRKALTSLHWALFLIVNGVIWIAGLETRRPVLWLVLTYLGIILAYDIMVWSRSRKRPKRVDKTPEQDLA